MTTSTHIRVRYAPSPTGEPHVGNIRTALFNWLFARRHGGKFVLRIEDTDVARTVPGALDAVLAGLRWLGLDWDEGPEVGGPYGPYLQSERLHIYQPIARRLVEEGKGYYCYCSPQRLEEMRKDQMRRKEPPRYDRRCRDLSPAGQAEQEKGAVPVIRFMTPVSGETRFHDLIRGEVAFENSTLDDFVLLKSDGYPTYHLANVIDDHLMEISHVMRAEEWLPSTPRHLLLYQALGYEPPLFAHLPMILGPDRSKLSKRHGATSILEYENKGYLPEAIVNFMVLLGWSLDDRTELFTSEELIRSFSLERVGKTGAIFNIEKLDWMNGVYIRQLPVSELVRRTFVYWKENPPSFSLPDNDYLLKVMPMVQDRARMLEDMAGSANKVGLTNFFFTEELAYDPTLLVQKGMTLESTREALKQSLASLEGLPNFDTAPLEQALRPLAEELGLKTGQLFGALRVATTGRTAAPPLFETMAALGGERCLVRIKKALALLETT